MVYFANCRVRSFQEFQSIKNYQGLYAKKEFFNTQRSKTSGQFKMVAWFWVALENELPNQAKLGIAIIIERKDNCKNPLLTETAR